MAPYFSIGLALASGAAFANSTAIPPAAEPGSLDAFAAADKACSAWGDGCTVCRRRSAAVFVCSTPGIACQPSSLVCEDRRPLSGPAH